ncbi:putative G2/M phase checkpoint control protein Sum2 [Fimicolochytrium jonesii]|uniref:putative G2/M phase checkpoint control protein Sum2 n=1 Tax=Fimicolochytrium jonesii TaxID=1396493 RepID=UPI0022FE7C2A|nr:putative G2/M phase checkpoint control protein Sum2 [Fimicolochytrium jonesii]KAI8818665.1 putative G2/M phase checkpoint control protein Sum2 [Fimicolochytrium jonesii]
MMPYIGSKISLISKSDVRYEGILVEINQENSTVSLENVHSWGTEGRKARREDEISPSEEPFPFVVFRGADVKDLHVMTAPSKAPAPNPMRVPNDPAVISVRRQHIVDAARG